MIQHHGSIHPTPTVLDVMEYALGAMRELKHRIEKLESGRCAAEPRAEVFQQYMSVRAHAAKNMRAMPDEDVLPTEHELADYCRHCGIPIGNVPDPLFGQLRAFPEWVLDDIRIALTHL